MTHQLGPPPGVPYAERRGRHADRVLCPACGRTIHLHDRKDAESYSGVEYAEHYVAQAVAEGQLVVANAVVTP